MVDVVLSLLLQKRSPAKQIRDEETLIRVIIELFVLFPSFYPYNPTNTTLWVCDWSKVTGVFFHIKPQPHSLNFNEIWENQINRWDGSEHVCSEYAIFDFIYLRSRTNYILHQKKHVKNIKKHRQTGDLYNVYLKYYWLTRQTRQMVSKVALSMTSIKHWSN